MSTIVAWLHNPVVVGILAVAVITIIWVLLVRWGKKRQGR